MSVKNAIDDLKNQSVKLKKVTSNINTTIISLSGEKSNNLSEVPKKINDLVFKYNKVAIMTPNIQIKTADNIDINIPLNLNFDPNFIYIEFENKLLFNFGGIYGKFGQGDHLFLGRFLYDSTIVLDVKKMSKNSIILHSSFPEAPLDVTDPNFIIKKIIAIG